MAKKNETTLAVQGEFFTDYVKLKENGLGAIIDPDISYENWESAVLGFATALRRYDWQKERARFALGDLFLLGQEKFGEKFAQAFDAQHIDKHTADNVMWVCRAIPQGERNPALSFGHHEVVAGIDSTEIRAELLNEAETNHLPVSKFRKLRNEKYPSKKRAGKKKAADPKPDEVKPLTDAEAFARADEALTYLRQAEKELPFKRWVKTDLDRWAVVFAEFRRMERRAGLGHGGK